MSSWLHVGGLVQYPGMQIGTNVTITVVDTVTAFLPSNFYSYSIIASRITSERIPFVGIQLRCHR